MPSHLRLHAPESFVPVPPQVRKRANEVVAEFTQASRSTSRLICRPAGLSGRRSKMRPGAIRAIDYEVVDKVQAARIGLRATTEVGMVRCVDHEGRKITVIGQATHVLTLVASGEASDPAGMALKNEMFPVVMNGWLATS